MSCQFSLHSSCSLSLRIPHSSLLFCFVRTLWRRRAQCSLRTLLFLCSGRDGWGNGCWSNAGWGFWYVFIWRMLGLEMGGNADGDSHSPLPVTSFLPVICRWTIWMKMRSIFSGRLRTDSPVGAFVRSTRRERGRRSSTPLIRIPPENHP